LDFALWTSALINKSSQVHIFKPRTSIVCKVRPGHVMTAPDDDRIIGIALEFLRGISFRNNTSDYLARQRALSKSPASMASSVGSSTSHLLGRQAGLAWPVDTYYSGSLDGFAAESHSRILFATRKVGKAVRRAICHCVFVC
jgi:hypothetical protein